MYKRSITFALFVSLLLFTAAAQAQIRWKPISPTPTIPDIPMDGGIEGGAVSNPSPSFDEFQTQTAVNDINLGMSRPANPNLLFGDDLTPIFGTRLGIEGGQPAIYGAATAAPQVAIAYDTGYLESGVQAYPSTVALDGAPMSRRRGQTTLSPEGTQLGLSLVPNLEKDVTFRTDFQMEFFDGARLRLASGQVALGDGILYGGKTWTTFMDEYAVPASIAANTSAAGAVFQIRTQLGYVKPVSDYLRAFIAIESPTADDYTLVSGNDQAIARYPNLVFRLQWADSRDWSRNNTLHLAGMARQMASETTAFQEDFIVGWGLSLMAKMRPKDGHTFYCGAVTGQGVGSYIFGFANPERFSESKPAAGPSLGGLEALWNTGAYTGYSYRWSDVAMSNFGYGYAVVETNQSMPLNASKQVQNAWISHQVKVTSMIAVGIEYHYDYREVRSGINGENHRAMIVTQFLTK